MKFNKVITVLAVSAASTTAMAQEKGSASKGLHLTSGELTQAQTKSRKQFLRKI